MCEMNTKKQLNVIYICIVLSYSICPFWLDNYNPFYKENILYFFVPLSRANIIRV